MGRLAERAPIVLIGGIVLNCIFCFPLGDESHKCDRKGSRGLDRAFPRFTRSGFRRGRCDSDSLGGDVVFLAWVRYVPLSEEGNLVSRYSVLTACLSDLLSDRVSPLQGVHAAQR